MSPLHWTRTNPLWWARASVRERGVVRTTKIAASVLLDLLFDWRYGTETMRPVSRDALGAASENEVYSASYLPTKARPLLRLLTSLNLPRDCTFVDIGSGKGRVLLIASDYGFSKIVGIEFSERLCTVARENVEIFARRRPLKSWIEVIEADATAYEFTADECVVYLFNPFEAVVLGEVLQNLRRSLERHPRQIWLIYNTPVHHQLVKESSLFVTASLHEIGGNQFRVYSSAPSTRHVVTHRGRRPNGSGVAKNP